MPKITEARRASRRAEIARAALRCFARKGFQATSMAEIITESGLSAGAIYVYYSSKEELALEATRYVLDRRLEELISVRGEWPLPHPGILVERFMTGLHREIDDLGILIQVWGEAVSNPKMSEIVRGVFVTVRSYFRDFLEEWFSEEGGVDTEEAARRAETYAPIFVALCQGYMVQSVLVPGFDGREYLKSILHIAPVL
ncbi:TetR/AcrR family transcriptional regulator [Lysinibacter sp. HNR]|uniref:TetR/AcrR family transcriptional regulator n=1 Tax=Lysinibacter sp. HNR TaxID=3031408 RepID=UPI002435FE12|nr:TetR/AcrR family transcriptional regulator [Lysinibacter sp. HNR]WGD37894.1 TetR/AcrR family transcriptional regulator [Lysinibacter sp. HNR]